MQKPSKKPIFIPSKGRAIDSYLLQQLKLSGREWYYVVEPQDAAAYKKLTDRLIVLPQNDQGIAFVRNHILDINRQKSSWFWMMDDDITQFNYVSEKRNRKTSMERALSSVEFFANQYKKELGQAGLEYRQAAWDARPIIWNTYCDVCVLVNPRVSARYRKNLKLKEDRDFSLQVRASGLKTVRITKYSFNCPRPGTKRGGLDLVYKNPDTVNQSIAEMCKLWPGVCTPVQKKDGSLDVKINWKAFK